MEAIPLTDGDVNIALGEEKVGEEPFPADAIYVFAGDWTGDRVLKAAQLRQRGYAPLVLVASPMTLYGHEEGDLAVEYAVAHGYPRDWFEILRFRTNSTKDEVQKLRPELERRGIKRLIAVTSDFHTRRAGRLIKGALEPEIALRVVSAPYQYFTADHWWQDREGRKTVFFELTKTVTGLFGI